MNQMRSAAEQQQQQKPTTNNNNNTHTHTIISSRSKSGFSAFGIRNTSQAPETQFTFTFFEIFGQVSHRKCKDESG